MIGGLNKGVEFHISAQQVLLSALKLERAVVNRHPCSTER
jgi:hypothetical protein